jgi:hypothetical protein
MQLIDDCYCYLVLLVCIHFCLLTMSRHFKLTHNIQHSILTAPTPSQQQSLTTDFELSQICLVPTSDWDATTLGLGNRYDVYDGQQRLVTLNLLLAALRDSFVKEAREVNGGKRGVALEATANEISGMLKPDRVRKEDVLRITLRKRDNVLLEKILSPNNDNTENEGEEEMGIKAEKQHTMIDFGKDTTPTEYLSKLTSKEKSEMLAPLSSANARIVENFLHIADRLSLLSTRERLRLLDYIVERVHCELCYGVVLIDCFFIQTYDYSFCSTGLYTRNKSNCEEYCNESRQEGHG